MDEPYPANSCTPVLYDLERRAKSGVGHSLPGFPAKSNNEQKFRIVL